MASLVVAEEVRSGGGLDKRINPNAWWPGAVSDYCSRFFMSLHLTIIFSCQLCGRIIELQVFLVDPVFYSAALNDLQ